MASFTLPDDKSNDQILVLILNDLSEAFNEAHHSFFHLASKMLHLLYCPLTLCITSISPLLIPPLLQAFNIGMPRLSPWFSSLVSLDPTLGDFI